VREFISRSENETISFGEEYAKSLKPNDIVALFGDLGAGKTTLTKGIARGLKIKEHVTSPTFILINEYVGAYPLYHIDLYRLEDTDQIENLGISEYFLKGGICIIEWPERLKNLLPKNSKTMKIENFGENERKITY